jgi:serine phosphatase RsbU (regulator of sigma subunit)
MTMSAPPFEPSGVQEQPTAVADALLDTLFAHAPVGLAFYDTELRCRRVSATIAAINGRRAEDQIGRPLEELLGELGATIAPKLRTVLDSGEPLLDQEVSGETYALPGVERHWLVSLYPVAGPGGRPLGVGAVVVEQTDQRQADAQRDDLARAALSAAARAEAAQARAELSRADAERAQARMAFLAEATAEMTASMDYDATLAAVARAAVPVIADWCAITLRQADGGLDTLAIAHTDPAKAKAVRALTQLIHLGADASYGVARVVRTGILEHLPSIPDELLQAAAGDDDQLHALRELRPHASLIVPLKTPERTVGALVLASAESGRGFDPEDIALAEALASRAALAVENARLYTERTHIAQALQAGLLPPQLPPIPGLEVAARYRAQGAQNEVGGDFYDLFAAGAGVWTALIGDVTGKGAEAASVTSIARHTLRAAALRDASPGDGLALLNELLLLDGGASLRLCTAICARICPVEETARITVANGGHLPPLILRADGSIETLTGHGPLVGALAKPAFPSEDVRLQPGDLLLLYTDGVTEIRTTDPDLGERRLREVLRDCAGATAEHVVGAVEAMAVDVQGGYPRDDIAILALKVPAAI